MSAGSPPRPSALRPAGFTLIEVLGALVIFSVGALMIMRAGSELTTQLRYSGARSEIAVLAQEQLDSIEGMPMASIAAGTTLDTVTVLGWQYERTVVVTVITPILARVDVSLAPIAGSGPSFTAQSFVSGVW